MSKMGAGASVCSSLSPDVVSECGVFPVGQKKLFKELISLEDYCRSCNKQPFQPKLGEACCAQFSGETIVCPSISLASVKHSFHFAVDKGKTPT